MTDWMIGLSILIALFMIYHLVRFFTFKKTFIPVLMYHRVTDYLKPESLRKQMHKGAMLDLDLMKVSLKSFDEQMAYLKKKNYVSKGFDKEAFKRNRKDIYLTFDDGYEDNFLNAFPILEKNNQTATIYLVSSLVGCDQFMPIDQNEQIQENRLLTWQQVKNMHDKGIIFGSHTHTHPWLNDITDEFKLKEEIVESKRLIEKHLNEFIYSFAYPAGLYNDQTLELVKKHYSYGLATSRGSDLSLFNKDSHLIEREAISRLDSLFVFKLKVWGIHRYIRKLKLLNIVRRLFK